MHRKKSSLYKSFRRFLSGKADSREQSILWSWIWKLDLAEEPSENETVAAGERIWNKISAQTLQARQSAIVPLFRKAVVAAAVLVVVSMAGWWLITKDKAVEVIAGKITEISSDGNAIRHIDLPDGSQVILNIHSSISFDDDYNKNERRISLHGEGYFKVAPGVHRAFIVQSNGIETRALGTAFNIEARDTEKEIRVALTEGKVQVGSNVMKATILEPGQILHYNKTTSAVSTLHYTTDVTAWTLGGLVFNEIPLSEALERLSQRYHVKLKYNKEKLAGKTVTASFSKTNLQHVLINILYPHDLKYLEQDSTIIIR